MLPEDYQKHISNKNPIESGLLYATAWKCKNCKFVATGRSVPLARHSLSISVIRVFANGRSGMERMTTMILTLGGVYILQRSKLRAQL